ncbi:MAG TPA: transposase, partial [Methylomicrobium sp.]|nr:transposase [Methylomicrobium sp.]
MRPPTTGCAHIDGAAGAVEELERIVKGIRAAWPTVRIIVRGDSGFCREAIMSWCETNQFDFVLGLPKNSRLIKIIKEDMVDAEIKYRTSGRAARIYADFQYQTVESWANPRRVISKAEHLSKGANPRFVVTSLS